MPRKRGSRKGAAGSSSGAARGGSAAPSSEAEHLEKGAAAGSSSGAARRGSAAPSSEAEHLEKGAAAGSSSGAARGVSAAPSSEAEHLEKGAAGGSSAAPSSGAEHVEKGAAGAGWIQRNLNMPDTASSGGVPTVHPGKGAAGTVSSGEMLDKKAATVKSGGAAHMLERKSSTASTRGSPMTHPGKEATGSGSSGTMLQQKAAAASSGGTPTARHGKVVTSSVSTGGILHAVASSGGMLTTLPGKGAVGAGLSEEMPPNNDMALSGESPALCALDGNTTAQDCEESVANESIEKLNTLPSAKISQKHCTEDKADMGLSGGILQKQNSKVEADSGLSEEMLHEHPAKKADTAKDIQEPDSNEIVHVNEEGTEIKEAELLIKQLNESRIGEPISEQEFLGYLKSLACQPPWINLRVKLKNGELSKLNERHALYRLRYYKHKVLEELASEEELHYDKLDKSVLDISEDDCSKEFLIKERFFRRLEQDKPFDWFFHPDYLECSFLDDYQRLVPRNNGIYSKWSEYHKYLHSYELEREYLRYCEELSKQLKWMEPYVGINRKSIKWSKISSRGALQAIKIAATSFPKITSCLAYTGYYECKESMAYDTFWFKEYDGLFFEIWRRVTKGMSFEKAMREVFYLNMFPIRQREMEAALEDAETMMMMKVEFLTCTAAIETEVKEDKAKELIKEAVYKQVEKPKSYEEYIIRKIQIARIIGILDSEE